MAYITYGSVATAFPAVYSDPKYPKDIVINGILFDIDTFTPKIGSHVMMWTGDYSVGGTKSWSGYDDDDSAYFGLWNNDSISGQYTTSMSPNYPYVQRDIKTDGSHYQVAAILQCFEYIMGQTAIYGRDFLDHPLACSHYNSTISKYIEMYSHLNYTGSGSTYEGSDGWTRYQDKLWTFDQYGSHLWDADTNSGMLYTQLHSHTTVCVQKLGVRTYTADANLATNTKTEIYAPSTGDPVFIHHLTKSNNGDHFFLAHKGLNSVGSGRDVDLLRYDNSSNSITVEYDNMHQQTDAKYPMCIPSNVVYHQKTGDTSTSKKICYYYKISSAQFNNLNNRPYFIEMDVVNNTITRTACTGSYPTFADSTEDDLWIGSFSEGEGPYVLAESRILSASQDINSQKYLFTFLQSNGVSHATAYDHCYMISKISASDPTVISGMTSNTTRGVWEDLLTASTKNTLTNDIVPWCVAPLNVEHTLMMVYCKHSTHLIKFDTSAETLTEIWMDDDTYFNEVMWLPTGKILTTQYENKFSSLGATIVDFHAPKPIQVWSEDLIYNVDITTSSNYVSYSGSDVSNTLSISAYDGGNSRVATNLTLQIVGPALFDNSTKTKTVTTSASAAVTETITINDDGHVEVKVIEIQS